MNRQFSLIAIAAAALIPLHSFAAPAKLTLENYLAEVIENNPSLQASLKSAEGAVRRKHEGDLLTLPYIFGSISNYDDRREKTQPTFEGIRTKARQQTVGMGINSPIGLAAKYSFNLSKIEKQYPTATVTTNPLIPASATNVPTPNAYAASNTLELTQSLFRNGFGSEVRAQKNALEAGLLALSYGERFKALSQRMEAENTYWRLSFARKAVEIQKEVLERAERILDWAKKRVNLQLGDRADLLQAQASYDLRRLELQNALEEERSATRAFNLLRNLEADTLNETLDTPTTDATLKIAPMEKGGTRFDIRAAEYQEMLAIANAQLDREKANPTLDLFALFNWYGLDGQRHPAVKESFHSSHSETSIGIKFTMPLAVHSITQNWKGTSMAKEAASLNLERKKLDEALEWSELINKFHDARSRLKLTGEIEKVQKEKFESERQRLLRGRTTTYQALIFEQDYAQSQLLRIRTQAEVLRLHSQMKLFRGEL